MQIPKLIIIVPVPNTIVPTPTTTVMPMSLLPSSPYLPLLPVLGASQELGGNPGSVDGRVGIHRPHYYLQLWLYNFALFGTVTQYGGRTHPLS